MAAPSLPPRSHEPDPLLTFVLFFAGLLSAGLIGIWLWNANPSVSAGTAFGTPNQIGAVQAGGATTTGKPEAGGADPALVQKGQQLAQQFGCVACHSITGQAGAGPTWKGLAGSQRELANGQKVPADDAYLRESIIQPDAKIAKGFAPGIMAGAVTANEAQIQADNNLDALIAYIKSVR